LIHRRIQHVTVRAGVAPPGGFSTELQEENDLNRFRPDDSRPIEKLIGMLHLIKTIVHTCDSFYCLINDILETIQRIFVTKVTCRGYDIVVQLLV